MFVVVVEATLTMTEVSSEKKFQIAFPRLFRLIIVPAIKKEVKTAVCQVKTIDCIIR